MSRARWVAAFTGLAAIAIACTSSRPPADSAPTVDPNYSPPTANDADTNPADYYYEGCDPTEITDGAIGGCVCYDPDAGPEEDSGAGARSSGITFVLPCGFTDGICSSSNNLLLFCSPSRQGVFFPNCPNVYSPDGAPNIPPCAPGTNPVNIAH